MKTTNNNSAIHVLRLLLTSRNIFIVACILIVTGYALMDGPASSEHTFNTDIFSTRRIVVAPMLCLAGYLLVVVSILRKKNDNGDK